MAHMSTRTSAVVHLAMIFTSREKPLVSMVFVVGGVSSVTRAMIVASPSVPAVPDDVGNSTATDLGKRLSRDRGHMLSVFITDRRQHVRLKTSIDDGTALSTLEKLSLFFHMIREPGKACFSTNSKDTTRTSQ